MPARFWAWLVLPAAVVVACQERSDDSLVSGALVADTPIAQKEWPGILLEFGSPAALPLLGDGWSFGETGPEGNAFRWALGDQASFRFESRSAGERLAWLECLPYRFPKAPTQVLELTLNDRPLPLLQLREGRSRYPIEISLVEGDNEVDIRFRYARSPRDVGQGEDRRRLAAAFYRFEVPAEDVPSVAGKPGPFALVEPRTGSSGVFLPAGGRLSYFLRIPPGARLSVEAGAREPERLLAPAGARLLVRARSQQGVEVEETKEASAPSGEVIEAELSLASLAGEEVELSFEAPTKDLFVRPALLLSPDGPPTRGDTTPLEGVNVLVIVLDGASASRMSAYGYPKPTTPVVEKLAGESVVFDNAISQAVYTIASVGSVLTGQYPERHQSVSFADRLPSSAVTLPGLMTLGGFVTAAFSGNAVVSSTFGLDRGYEEFVSARELEGYTGHGDSVLPPFFEWLEKHHQQRFLAYVHFREPHFPYNPPPPFDTHFGPAEPFPHGIDKWEEVDTFNRAAARGEEIPPAVIERIRSLYEGNLAYVDQLVGEILARLADHGIDEKTVVVLTADHGEALFEHGFIGHNTQLYEESVRVPLMVRLPQGAARQVSQVVELIDLAPTILDLVGLGGESAVGKMQGRSLVPLLNGKTLPPRPAFSRTLWNKPRYSVRNARYKYIWDSRTGSAELYDLESDPGEQINLRADRRIMAGFLRQQLFHWLREQEHLRAGAPPPEDVLVPDDLSRHLRGLGYIQYLERENKESKEK